MKVSIIIPLYNAELYIGDTIKSLLLQTYANKEIIIVDDSSTDNSYSIAKYYASDIVRVFSQPNSGAAIARNTGLLNSTGDYIQFMDADDFLSPDKIEKQVAALKSTINKVAVCNYVEFKDGEDLKKCIVDQSQEKFIYSTDSPPEFLINLLGGNGNESFIQTNCWLLPRQLVLKVGGWRNYRSVDDDGEFFTRALMSSTGIIYVKEVMVYYRRNKNSLSLSNSREYHLLKNMLLTIDLKYSHIATHTSNPNLKKAFAKQYLSFAVYNYQHQKVLSAIAYKRYKKLGYRVATPEIGGKLVELVRFTFGWRIAIIIRHLIKHFGI